MKVLSFFVVLLTFCSACNQHSQPAVQIQGEQKQWHKVTFEVQGPELAEWSKTNPFLDYELKVVFSKGDRKLVVPGYFAADGNAGETSAEAGNIWKAHFRPDEVGTWQYQISFKKGKNIVVIDDSDFGEPLAANGLSGTLEIEASDKTGKDFRGKGRIMNGGKGYFRFQGSNEIWIKNGADSPENFLAYAEFDQTERFSLTEQTREGKADPKKGVHRYQAHAADWQPENPTWQNGKGKGIIGAINYLSSQGVNSVYMLTMNIQGDGKDVWPYSDYNERYRFDCSKLDQWEILFEHMEHSGVMAHLVLQETENECLLDGGETGVQRKVYLREMIARFGHHLALSWNLGEENGPTKWSPVGQTEKQKKAMARYLKATNPYPCNVVLHSHANDAHQDEYFVPLLGFDALDGPSLQIGNPARVHQRVRKWVDASAKAGKRWLVNLDEIGPASKGVLPDEYDAKHDTVRQHCLWGALLGGATGVEWYFGYRFPHNDLNLEDFRSRDAWWTQSTIATQFVAQFPLEEMTCTDELVKTEGAYCFSQPGSVYLMYYPAGSSQRNINLKSDKAFTIKWFNPRTGGNVMAGSKTQISGTGFQPVGEPPAEQDKDWIAVIR